MFIAKQHTHFFLRASIAILLVGALFKTMHWSGASVLLLTGGIGIAIFYSLRFLQKNPKSFLDYTKLFLLLSFLLHYTFRVFHLAYGYLFTMGTQLGLLLFLIAYVREVLYPKENTLEVEGTQASKTVNRKGVSTLLYGLSAIGIIVGALLKILHWEFYFITGNMLLFVGLLAAAIAVLFPSQER